MNSQDLKRFQVERGRQKGKLKKIWKEFNRDKQGKNNLQDDSELKNLCANNLKLGTVRNELQS